MPEVLGDIGIPTKEHDQKYHSSISPLLHLIPASLPPPSMAELFGSCSGDPSEEGREEELSLSSLPFDVIVLVCEYLLPDELVHFSLVCKVGWLLGTGLGSQG